MKNVQQKLSYKQIKANTEQWKADQQVNLLLAAVIHTNREADRIRGDK
jgi:hypothetical protein